MHSPIFIAGYKKLAELPLLLINKMHLSNLEVLTYHELRRKVGTKQITGEVQSQKW